MNTRTVRRSLRLGGTAARHRFRPGAVVLLYHRVAEVPINLWAMSVSPARFEAHLRIIGRFTRPMSLVELAERAAAGTLPARSVAITFDDGYVDNLEVAKPLLERYGLPATVFATGGTTLGEAAYWWDELARYTVHAPDLPPSLSLDVEGTRIAWHQPAGQDQPASLNDRLMLCAQVRAVLHAVRPDVRRNVLDAIAAWSGRPPPPPWAGRPMTPGELRTLTDGGSIEVGAHTMSHPSLPGLEPSSQQKEVEESRRRLEAAIGAPVTSFSYPFGDAGDPGDPLDDVVMSAGFLRSCTSERRTMRGVEPSFRLPRYSVGDWTAREFATRLAAWLME